MSLMVLIVGGLITWRVSYMLVHEKGPRDILLRLRAFLAQNQQKSGGLFDLISCMACTSVWIGAVTALWVAGDVLELIAYTLAFSAITVLIERYTKS